jgi:hypothetical protein
MAMIEIKAVSIGKEIEAVCKLIKVSAWIHPENHDAVMLNLYLEIQNIGNIPIDEIVLYFHSLTEISRIEDKTLTYTPRYRKFIGASSESKNHPADYFSQETKRTKKIVVKYKEAVPPKESAATLVGMELKCSLEKTPLLRRIITREKAWEFGLWTWRKSGVLMANHKFLNFEEEDIWVMIPKTLYRSSEFLRSSPLPRLSRPLANDEMQEGKYDRNWVREGTYCVNWNVENDLPIIPRQQMYSIQHVTQDVPAISLIGLAASIITLFSLSIEIVPIAYLFLALMFIFLTLVAVIYSYSFFQFSFSTRSLLLGMQSFVGGMFIGASLHQLLGGFTIYRGIVFLAVCILAAFAQIYFQAMIYFRSTRRQPFLSTAISHTVFSFLATFLIILFFQEAISPSSQTGYFLALTGICLIGGIPTEWITLIMSERPRE